MKLVVSLLAAGVLLLAGCGGSSGGGSSGGGSSTTAAGSTASAASSSSSTASTSASASQATFASNANCQALADMGRKYVAEIQSSVGGGGHGNWATLLKADQAMADASPSAIHSDAEYVVHTFAGFVSAMTKVGFTGGVPTASQIAELLPLESQLKSAQFVAAVNHIKAWINSNCHGVS